MLPKAKNKAGKYNVLEVSQNGPNIIANRIEPSWGIIGSATEKGWEENMPDIKLVELPNEKGHWKIKNIVLKKGEFKFRFCNDWNQNYGDNNSDKRLELQGQNIKVDAGTYEIQLDLSDIERANYKILVKN